MTRKQIEKKAKELMWCVLKEHTWDVKKQIEECAIMMADWALSYQWVSVEDELPKRKERYSKYVILRNRIGGHYIGCYDFEEKLWIDGKLERIYMDITHWMPIPTINNK